MGKREGAPTGRTGQQEQMSFEALVEAYQHKLYNVTLRMVGNPDDALDLVQNVFLKAYRSLKKFRGTSQVYTWLYRITVNSAISFRRGAAARPHHVPLPAGVGCELPGGRDAAAPHEPLQSEDTMRRVCEAIAELDPELRTAVVLRDIENLSYSEIADIAGVPQGTVKSRLHRGRLLLRERLKDIL